MAKLEIIGIPQSTYVRAIRMLCEEKGIDYELKPEPPQGPAVKAIHPFGKIPVMRHGDFELSESKAIATYIDRAFPGPQMLPSDLRLAAAAEEWVSLVNTVFDRTLVREYLLAYVFPKTADGNPDRKLIDGVVPAVKEQIGILDRRVAKTGHLVGSQFTFADINLMPILFYIRQMPEGGEAMRGAKDLSAYYDRHAERASFKNTTPPPPQQRQQPQPQAKAS